MRSTLSRRSFLGRTAVAGAALPFPLPFLRSAASPLHGSATPPPFRKAVKLGMVGAGKTVLEKFQLLRELEINGVELDSPNDLDTAEVIDARDQSGLVIHGVVDSAHWSQPFSHPEAKVRKTGQDALETALHDAKAYGATTVLVVPGVVNKEVSYRDAWFRSRSAILPLVPLAEEVGVRIAFENVWNNFLLSPLEMRNFIDAFDSPLVGAYFDVGNVVRYAWPEHWIEVLADKIFKVNVKEYSRKKQQEQGLWKGFQAELLEGDNDWPTVLAALKAVDYQGWFTAEVAGGDRERLAFLAERMDRILAS